MRIVRRRGVSVKMIEEVIQNAGIKGISTSAISKKLNIPFGQVEAYLANANTPIYQDDNSPPTLFWCGEEWLERVAN